MAKALQIGGCEFESRESNDFVIGENGLIT